MRCLLAALLVLTACRTPGEHAARFESTACAANKPACLRKILDVHGGLQRFRALRYERYTIQDTWRAALAPVLSGHPDGTQSVVLTLDRRGHASGQLSGSNLLALPFRLADDGVVLGDITDDNFHGRPVMAMDVTFEAPNPKDRWTLYFHPVTMGLIGTTFRGSDLRVPPVDVMFDAWQVVQGLLVPQQLTFDLRLGHIFLHQARIERAELFVLPPADWPAAPPDADRSGGTWSPF